MTRGAVFKLERNGHGFAAAFVSPAMIYPCVGIEDSDADAKLRNALAKGGVRNVTRLVRRRVRSGEACWLSGEDWFLA